MNFEPLINQTFFMTNKQDKREPVEEQVHKEFDKGPLNNAEDDSNNTPERTEQEEDIISPTADTDLVEDGGIRNDSVLAGENSLSEMLPDQQAEENASTKKDADTRKDELKTADADSKQEGKK